MPQTVASQVELQLQLITKGVNSNLQPFSERWGQREYLLTHWWFKRGAFVG